MSAGGEPAAVFSQKDSQRCHRLLLEVNKEVTARHYFYEFNIRAGLPAFTTKIARPFCHSFFYISREGVASGHGEIRNIPGFRRDQKRNVDCTTRSSDVTSSPFVSVDSFPSSQLCEISRRHSSPLKKYARPYVPNCSSSQVAGKSSDSYLTPICLCTSVSTKQTQLGKVPRATLYLTLFQKTPNRKYTTEVIYVVTKCFFQVILIPPWILRNLPFLIKISNSHSVNNFISALRK